jgi:hypothetical protein
VAGYGELAFKVARVLQLRLACSRSRGEPQAGCHDGRWTCSLGLIWWKCIMEYLSVFF